MKTFKEMFKEQLIESVDIRDFQTARFKEGAYLGFAAIGFRFSNNPGMDANKNEPYLLGSKGDSWFRKDEGHGTGYGLAIRKVKVTSKRPFEFGSGAYSAYKAKITYNPVSNTEDDSENYETDDFWIFVHETFELKDVIDFINKNVDKYVP